ncbi:uncharacterized protein I303_103733 [Kwoniella dejecticola CBS 10117]|uniref:Major facilitator superfamily (MFS) profile domain-containing protein n=1 Tax=Kwoniella dejecticola CBS 10117 TaxID=1296121 RepID=A0A1A6A7K0_9TREE|nr:uncharacterized protein I303_03750 [Kwoniella dejecticola CBS 10117]OBR86033.1 hypothetical protein I303_03750 [Kwoniella dejecticola CBS 10117]
MRRSPSEIDSRIVPECSDTHGNGYVEARYPTLAALDANINIDIEEKGDISHVISGSELEFEGRQNREDRENCGNGEEEVTFPDGGLRAWLCVLGGTAGMFCGYGLAPSAGAFQTWYKTHFLVEYTQSQVAWIGGIQAFVTFGLSIFTGSLFDLYGHKYLIASGTFLLTLGYCLLSLCTRYYQIFLCHTTLIPVGMNFMFIAPLGVIGQWFSKKRGLAFGTIATGASIGAIVWPLIWANCPQRIGFGWTMRLIALICFLLGLSAYFLLKTRLPPKPPGPFFHFQAFKSIPYSLVALACFTWVFAFFFLNMFVGTYGHLRGWNDIGPYFLIFLMAGSTMARIPSGILADKIGPYNISIISNILMTILLWLMLISKTIAATITISILFGITSATFVSLQAPCVTRLCVDMRFAGTYVGMIMFISSLAQLAGPPAAGALLGSGSLQDQLDRFPHAIILAGVMLTLSTVSLIAARLYQNRTLLAFV